MKVIVLFCLMLPIYSMASSCEDLVSECSYYACLESEKHCGKKGYLLNFGGKYCDIFKNSANEFTALGQLWLQMTRSCLTSSIELLDDHISCKELANEAFKNHVPCYLDSGFCSLPLHDQKMVIKKVSKAAWRPQVIKAAITVLKRCHNKN